MNYQLNQIKSEPGLETKLSQAIVERTQTQSDKSVDTNFRTHPPLRFTNFHGEAVPYIVIEGVKGVGKGTVLNLVRQALEKCGIRALALNPTQALASGHYWEQIDQALPLRHLDWWKERLYAARSQVHSHRVYEDLEQYNQAQQKVDVILGDRSILTSLVTRWPQEDSLDHVVSAYKRVRELESSIPLPDQVIYLDADLDTINERLHGRDRSYGLEDETQARISEAMQAYHHLASLASIGNQPFAHIQWTYLDASQTLECTVNKVLELLFEAMDLSPESAAQRRLSHLEHIPSAKAV